MNTLQIDTDYDAYYPGSDLQAIITWDFESKLNAIELRLTWNTAGKGTRDLAVVQTEEIAVDTMNGSKEVTIRLPWGPYSFSGKLISLIWAIEVVARPKKESARKEFTMGPDANEVFLTSVGKSPMESHG
ncbi:MAG TPA: hypothetical protein VNQ76_11265 [Planctomicrobium sp.]|nr:hypothetical protein [Planctomicrobium sp.]